AGSVLTRAGDPGDEFFLILDGTVRIEVASGRYVSLHPGAFFGEMSLLDGGPRSATAVTDTPARLLVIDRANFSRLQREVPELTQTLLLTLSQRVRQVEARKEQELSQHWAPPAATAWRAQAGRVSSERDSNPCLSDDHVFAISMRAFCAPCAGSSTISRTADAAVHVMRSG